MTVAVTKTKAEQALSQNFETVAAKLPGSRAIAEARKAAIGTFAALGLPHRRIEEWKYTDLRVALKEALPAAARGNVSVPYSAIQNLLGPLAKLESYRATFLNGFFLRTSEAKDWNGRLELSSLADVLRDESSEAVAAFVESSRQSMDAVAALNTAFVGDGAVIRVADGRQLDRLVHLVFVDTNEGSFATTRNLIEIGKGAKVTLLESHLQLARTAPTAHQSNAMTRIRVGEGAEVNHIKLYSDGGNAAHVSRWHADVGARANYRVFQLTVDCGDGGIVRNEVHALFSGEGARLDISGVFLGRARQHIDTTLVVDHAVPGCVSRELFKGVLTDRARGVFQGKVIVRPDAQKSDGKQMAQALMLSADAEFDSKPELEIYADDVICGHGSTAAELDEDLLFYMRTRGIPPEEARALLIESFIGEAIDKVEDERVREAFSSLAKHRLAQLSGARAPDAA